MQYAKYKGIREAASCMWLHAKRRYVEKITVIGIDPATVVDVPLD